jgi:phenylalanyl-tRNA synthetase alpha chain
MIMEYQQEIVQIKKQALEDISNITAHEEIERLRIRYLGRKGIVSLKLKDIKLISPEDRPGYGKACNDLKSALEEALDSKRQEIGEEKAGPDRFFDITLPGDQQWRGHAHPLIQTMNEIIDIFIRMGFGVAYGPDVETDYYNFEALNFPKEHPSRDTQDTFYLDNGLLLRTQTSPVQVRVMESKKPPIRIISPGRCYRVDNFDSSHSPVFYQIEGLYVDTDVTMSDLTGTLDIFAKALFGASTKTKLAPHFFPFTEPSAEHLVSCPFCKEKGCTTCGHSGWLEIMGCGMVHPNVFKMVEYDADKYTGFAFGMGVERVCMLKYGINDMRLLFENDMRFIRQF